MINPLLLWPTLATGLLFASADAAAEDREDEKAPALVGKWECVKATVDGKALPEKTVQQLRLTITPQRYITTKGDETLFDSTFRLDTSVKPPRIYLLGNEGELAGKEAKGIYALENDRLVICYAMPGDSSPTTFASAPGSKAYLVTWKRIAR
jgi:uncharacterized protein (TIGR03067 family)